MTWYVFRPLQWSGPSTPPADRRRGQFKASWTDTLTLLEQELAHLDAKNVVWQVDVRDADIRLDGQLRAKAWPSDPSVRILFDSRHGPLVYATDQYQDWQHNVRAIALSLEALRAVDRHGVTRGAEQYKGFRAIGAGPTAMPAAAAMSREQAARFIADHQPQGDPVQLTRLILAGDHRAGLWFRFAAKRLHPDADGSTELFQRLQEAKRVLDIP